MKFLEKDDRLIYTEDGKELGHIILKTDEDTITITHTIVPEENSGKGIAGKLVDAVVEKARKENKKIIPICTYAKAKLEGNDIYNDILKK